MESSYTLCTAVIGAKPKQRWLKDLLTEYDQRKFVDDTGKIDNKPNSQYIFEYLSAKENLKDSHTVQKLSNGLVVFPQEYFSPINYLTMKTNITEQTYTIHHYNGTWKSERERRKDKILGLLTRIIGEKNRKRIKQIIKKE